MEQKNRTKFGERVKFALDSASELIENNSELIINGADKLSNQMDDLGKNIEENLIRISYNVMYKKPGYSLKADILEFDLITKNIKIYMLNEKQKILAKSIID